MKRYILQSALFLLLGLGGFLLPTMAAAADPLVSTDWLEKNLQAKDLIIIDVRTESNYGVGHIPGAVNLGYSGWEPFNEEKGCSLMPTVEDFMDLMRELGINTNSHVIIYDHGNSISDATKGATSVWILETMGHKNVSYLDGGFTKWTFEGRVIDNVVPTPSPGNFMPKLDESLRAHFDEVKARVNDHKTLFVDARTPEQHFGVDKRGDVARYGHIPGSISLPANYLTNAGVNRAPATIKSRDVLEQIMKGVGMPADKNTPIIVYCNSCQFAGLNYFVLHDILGYTNVEAYDGSMLEYAANEDMPLVKFAWGKGIR